ncbi:MAG: hypothetical protein NTU97_01805, partial [Candidatus Magasanikbacteria bacterium]|nr:hypothetical protein [Candidatus Magasanikbacteria bacterium]
MKKIIKLFLFFLAFYFLLSFSLQTHAQAPEPTPSGNDTLNQIAGQFGTAVVETGLSGNDPRAIVMSVVKVALGLVAIIFLVLIVYAGYTWMTAG